MKFSSGPSRESTWGMIFLAAVPMLIMSFVVLIKKKMPFVRNAAVLKPGVDPIFAKRRVAMMDKSRVLAPLKIEKIR